MFIGEFSALGAAILWSVSSFVFTDATFRLGALLLNLSRMIAAIVMLLVTMYIMGIFPSINQSQLIYLTLSGFVGLVIGDSFLFKSFSEIGPRTSMLIMSTNPAIAAFLAYIFLNEELSLWAVVGIVVTLTGVFMVILQKPGIQATKFKMSMKGVIFAFLGAAGQGVGLIFAKLAWLDSDIHWMTATFVRILAAVIIMLPLAYFSGRITNPIRKFKNDKKAIVLVLIGAVLGPYLGISLSFIAIIYTKVGIASTLMSTLPIIMLPLSYFIYKEKLSFISVLGAFIAVAGVSILFLK